MQIKNKKLDQEPAVIKKLTWSLLVILFLTLFACSDEKRMQDLHRYIANLKKKITQHQKKDVLVDIHFPIPVNFQDQTQRDPFESEGTNLGNPVSNNPLLAFPVKSFEYIGNIVRGNQTWAIVKAPDNKVYQVTINTRLGNHYGRIIKIDTEQMVVEELILPQGTEGTRQAQMKQIVTLQLKSKSE